MKFIITADIHFGSRNDQGFSMQTKYTEQAPELVHALGQAAVEQGGQSDTCRDAHQTRGCKRLFQEN